MRVFNLTDVETPELKQRGLVRQFIALGDTTIAPGDTADIHVNVCEPERARLTQFIELGMAAVSEAPATYTAAKPTLEIAPPPMEPPAPVVTLSIETVVPVVEEPVITSRRRR